MLSYKCQDITDAALAVMMLMAWDQDVDFDDLLGRRPTRPFALFLCTTPK